MSSNNKNTKLRPALMLMLSFIMMIVTACGAEEAEPIPPTDPLTGATIEEGFDEAAADRRVAAFVIENAPEARPQWGIDDAEYSPDIILEGEVEAGITRMLWMYSDYNKLPQIMGPMRSARPPYIKFSELFDAVFIHWGASHSKGLYIGANTVFKDDDVDHIDQMTFQGSTELFGRDETRDVATEHTGILYGDKVADAIKECKFRELPDNYTVLQFNETAQPMSDERADEVTVNYSDKTAWEKTKWSYDPADQKYHSYNFSTSDTKTDVARDNLLILYDKTEYIDKDDYQGEVGSTVTYCEYALGGGKGQLMSQGTVKNIEWKVEDGKLLLIDPESTAALQAEGEEADSDKSDEEEGPAVVQVSLNKGKTWIGWVSSNNGGEVEIVADESRAAAAEADSPEEGAEETAE